MGFQNIHPQRRRIGQLDCMEWLFDPQQNAPWVIMFHGFGADCHDLTQLPHYIPNAEKFNWLFPNGILPAVVGPGQTMGRAWWQIDLMAFQTAATTGAPRDMSETVPEGLSKAREIALKAIGELHAPWENIILGGFSQGSMLALDLVAHAPTSPKGLIIYSGTPLALPVVKPLLQNKQNLKFFQSHGKSDAILNYKVALKLESFLKENGLKGNMLSFEGGHEIPPRVLDATGEYLLKLT